MNKEPPILIIIVNLNGKEDTLECIDSLKKSTYTKIKIFVVDNGSQSNEAEEIRKCHPDIQLYRAEENLGFAKANNLGFEYAIRNDFPYVWILNNDTVIRRNSIAELVNFAYTKKGFGILSPFITYYNSDIIWFAGGSVSTITGMVIHHWKKKPLSRFNTKMPFETNFVTGCAAFFPTDLLERFGGFDENLFVYYEDVDICMRLKNLGYKFYIVPTSIIAHKKSSTGGIIGSDRLSALQAYFRGRNAIIVGRKNLSGLQRFLFFSSQFHLRLLYNLAYIREFDALKWHFKGLWDGLFRKDTLLKPPRYK